MSLRGRKNLPVGSSIFSWAGAPAILDDTASASRIGALNARSLAEADRAPYPRRHHYPRPVARVVGGVAATTPASRRRAGASSLARLTHHGAVRARTSRECPCLETTPAFAGRAGSLGASWRPPLPGRSRSAAGGFLSPGRATQLNQCPLRSESDRS